LSIAIHRITRDKGLFAGCGVSQKEWAGMAGTKARTPLECLDLKKLPENGIMPIQVVNLSLQDRS